MRFSVRHRFDAPVERVEAALFAADLPAFLAAEMTTVVSIEPIERVDDGARIRRRVRYQPEPLIKRMGPKQVDPRWMAWIEESTYDRAARRGEFVNRPVVARVAELLENRGTLTLRDAGAGTERIIEGELRVKVPIVGRLAEKVIHAEALKILEDEARAFARYLGRAGG